MVEAPSACLIATPYDSVLRKIIESHDIMQQRVVLGAVALVVVVVGATVVRKAGRHEAGRVADQGIQALLENLPPGYAIQHGAVDYNPLTSTATIHDVRIAREGRVSWAADTVTLSSADANALRDVFDPAAYPNGKPAWTGRRLLLSDAAANGVHASVYGPNKLDYTIGSVTLHRLSGRPFLLPPTPENRAKPEFGADAGLALAADSVVETDTVISGGGDSDAKVTIASIEASNYDGGKLGSFLVKTVALDAKDKRGAPVHATLESFSVKDADATRVLHAVQQQDTTKQALSLTAYGSFDLSRLEANLGGNTAFQVKDFHAEQGEPDSDGVRTGHAALHGMTIALAAGAALPPRSEEAIAAFGMRSITMDIDGGGRGKAGGESEFTEDVMLHDLGTLHLKGAFEGYVAPLGNSTAPAAMAALLSTKLERATLSWDDASLTDRIFKVAAAQGHTTPELVRSQLAVPILALGVLVPDQPDVADQLTAFLDHPHNLTVVLKPAAPISLGEVARAPATDRAHLLGLHVTGN